MISLKEALVRKNRINNIPELVRTETVNFLSNYYYGLTPDKYELIENNDKFIVNIYTTLDIREDAPSLTNEFFEFGTVAGSFQVARTKYIKNLIGSPKEIEGDIIISYNESLETLQGCEIDECINFSCVDNPKLKILSVGPKKVSGYYILRDNVNLSEIGYDIERVDRYFEITACSRLKTLKGTPKTVGWDFTISECLALTSLDMSTKHIFGSFECIECPKIKTLKGLPSQIGRNVKIDDLSDLEDLKGTLKQLGGSYSIRWCDNLKSLKGIPRSIGSKLILMHLINLVDISDIEHIEVELNIKDCPRLPVSDISKFAKQYAFL